MGLISFISNPEFCGWRKWRLLDGPSAGCLDCISSAAPSVLEATVSPFGTEGSLDPVDGADLPSQETE